LLFTGATASVRGRRPFVAFASAKAGLRSVAQSCVSEAGADGLLDPDAIAATYRDIHRQPRSAWTHELDLRPYKESF